MSRGLTWLAEPTPEWFEYAACRYKPRSNFFPSTGETALAARAKVICRGCPVRLQCLDYALDHGEKYGIWGGLTERERRKVRKQRRAA